MARSKWVTLVGLVFALGHTGCNDCQDEQDAMQAFLVEPSNLSCEGNADCEVVTIGCANVPRAFCGQVTLNKTAAASSRWKELRSAADDCAGDSCAVCAAALIPECRERLCGGPP